MKKIIPLVLSAFLTLTSFTSKIGIKRIGTGAGIAMAGMCKAQFSNSYNVADSACIYYGQWNPSLILYDVKDSTGPSTPAFFKININKIQFNRFPNSRNDGVANNMLYTDANGYLKSAPFSASAPTSYTASLSGALATTAYTVTHSLGYTPKTIIVTARNTNAAILNSIGTITSTYYVINFVSVPITGLNNILFDWVPIK